MSKYLTEAGWKSVSEKSAIADNGLKRALATFEKLGADKPEEKLRALESVRTLTVKMKTLLTDGVKAAKQNKAKPEVLKNLDTAIKYLTEVEKAIAAEKKTLDDAVEKADAAARAKEPPMLDRLVAAANTIPGAEGGRLKKVMAIAKNKPGSWKQLWFYNYATVAEFVQFHTPNKRREQMVKAGGGKLPFKGDLWVNLPFTDSLGNICKKGCPDKDLVTFLKWLDGQILYSVNEMSRVQNAGEAAGGGSAFGPSVDAFLQHVGKLASDKGHLYSAGY